MPDQPDIEKHLREVIGNLVIQIARLSAENELLRVQLQQQKKEE